MTVCVSGGSGGGRRVNGTDKALHAVRDIRLFVTTHEHELRMIIEWLLMDRGSGGGTESIGAGAGSGNSARDYRRLLRRRATIGIADIHAVANANTRVAATWAQSLAMMAPRDAFVHRRYNRGRHLSRRCSMRLML